MDYALFPMDSTSPAGGEPQQEDGSSALSLFSMFPQQPEGVISVCDCVEQHPEEVVSPLLPTKSSAATIIAL